LLKIYDNVEILPIPNKRIKDLTGQRFNRLLVKGYIGKNEKNKALWLCMCECEKYKIVDTASLKNGHVKSCGCLKNELAKESIKKCIHIKHGKSRSRIYRIYQGMKERCYNTNNKRYKNYGERGIIICEEWLNNENGFINFYNWAMANGYTDDLTIDRINVDGNYEASNCRWITNKEQQSNKTYHHLLEYNGKIQNIAKWSEETGLPYDVIWRRIEDNWNIEDILRPIRDKYLINDKYDIDNIINLYYIKKYSLRKIAKLYNTTHTNILNLLKRSKHEQD
jgi:hypothetical protein